MATPEQEFFARAADTPRSPEAMRELERTIAWGVAKGLFIFCLIAALIYGGFVFVMALFVSSHLR